MVRQTFHTFISMKPIQEKIKAAIQEGNYPIDAKKVAESFAALEGMISSN